MAFNRAKIKHGSNIHCQVDSAIPHPFILVGVKVRSALSNSTSESDSESEEMTMALDLSIAIAASFFKKNVAAEW